MINVSSQLVLTRKMDNASFNGDGKIPTFESQIKGFQTCWNYFSAYGKLAHLAVNRHKLVMARFSIEFTTEKAMNII
jgi:hypothetical protein